MPVLGRRLGVVTRFPRSWALWAASRPSQVALVLLVYALGVGAATTGPPVAASATAFARPLLARAAVGALPLAAVTVAVHYANEYADVDTDALTDRTPFSGGSGALAVTGLPAAFLGRAAAVAALAAAAATVAATASGALAADAAVLLGVVLVVGLAYSLPPFSLVRRGVGEPVNAALGGLLLPVYGVAVVGSPTPAAWLAALPFALVVGCNLLATHWPDRRADGAVGKRTLAVRWGPARIRRAYLALAALAAVATVALWWVDVLPDAVAAAHAVAVPFLAWGWTTLARRRSPLPAVAAMVALAAASAAAWWWVGVLA